MEKNETIVEYNGVKYILKKGVLHRFAQSFTGYTFNHKEYLTINIPKAYNTLRYEQIDLQQIQPTLRNEMETMFADIKNLLETNAFIYICKGDQGEMSVKITCAFLNESFLKGNYPIYYTSGYQFIEQITSENIDFFGYLNKVKLLAIDAFDSFLTMPPKYRQTIIYYLKSVLYFRHLHVLPTFILANMPIEQILHIVGMDIYSILKKDLKYNINFSTKF